MNVGSDCDIFRPINVFFFGLIALFSNARLDYDVLYVMHSISHFCGT